MPSYGVAIGASVSLVGILACLLAMRSIISDIDLMKLEIETGVQEMRVMSDDAWTRILTLHTNPSGKTNAPPTFGTLFGRAKRAIEGQCNCGANSEGCPAGPPGIPGLPGPRGEQGTGGEPGHPGASGISLLATHDQPGGCVQCPPGPQGEPGPEGPEGEKGFPGSNGKPGPAGEDGGAGAPGQDGEPGNPGQAGIEGMPGPHGADGSVGAPGLQGQPGPIGWAGTPGEAGQNGNPGEDGQQGPPGPQGTPGFPGKAGDDGTPGVPGHLGAHGEDANYCPCPARSEDKRAARRRVLYQAICRFNYLRQVYQSAFDIRLGTRKLTDEEAIIRIQARTRGYFARKRVKDMRQKELDLLGMSTRAIVDSMRLNVRLSETLPVSDRALSLENLLTKLKDNFFSAVVTGKVETRIFQRSAATEKLYFELCLHRLIRESRKQKLQMHELVSPK